MSFLPVLLVDDNQALLELAGESLSMNPRVRVVGRASNGVEALDQVQRLRPELVIIDASLPLTNGLETARRLKLQPNPPRVIITTVHDSDACRSAAAEAGADGFICKSNLPTELPLLIDQLLEDNGRSLHESATNTNKHVAGPCEAPRACQQTILVVDDHPINRHVVVRLLKARGYRVVEAADGVEALGVARALRPDLILTDVVMPRMDGAQLADALRADTVVGRTPIIFYTAGRQAAQIQERTRAYGLNRVLRKPASPAELAAAVAGALACSKKPQPAVVSEGAAPLAQTNLHGASSLRLAALMELSLELAAEPDPQRVLRRFAHAARFIIGARFASIVLFDPAARVVHALASTQAQESWEELKQTTQPLHGEENELRRLLARNRLGRLRLPDLDAGVLGLPVGTRLHSLLGVALPLADSTMRQGGLYLADKIDDEEFSEEDERLTVALAGQLAAAYHNACLHAELREHAERLESEIVERKRIEQGLRATEERFRQLTDTIQELFFLAEPDLGMFHYVSPAVRQLWGRWPEELYANPELWLAALHPNDRERISAAVQLRKPEEELRLEFRIVRPDGEVRWVRAQVFPVRDASGRAYRMSGLAQDVTRAKQLEEQLLQSQKMEAFGRLAGGVAHDFNNLLTVITGYSEMLSCRLPAGDANRAFVDEVRKASDRATALTRQLLAFSRKQILAPAVLDLNQIVDNMEKMLHRLIGEDIELLTVRRPETPAIKADVSQIEQVIMNLVVNARDAMPDGGRLTIETGAKDVSATDVESLGDLKPGLHAFLLVSDTGCGMDGTVKARLFEPFFTTKGAGKGTGLGLATVYGIVKQSGGHIAVDSQPGQGATFKVYLPVVAENDPERRPGSVHTGLANGNETVLLVEDQDEVRNIAREALRGSGYTVLEARHGVEALAVCAKHRGRVDLLVSDVVMPKMGGRQLADHLRDFMPQLKVLLLSGYTDDALLRQDRLTPGMAFLHKPFTPSGLLRKIRAVLDQARPASSDREAR